MRPFVILSVLAFLLVVSTSIDARTWYVPSECATIQAGIDSASAGDTVLVADGTYTGNGNRDIDYYGKAITVRSENGDPAACIIDCEGVARGFLFQSGEGPGAVLEGFTIANGFDSLTIGEAGGAGIRCVSSSPTISRCTFSGNAAHMSGGGMYCGSSSPTLTDCTFISNWADQSGGGLYCHNSSPILSNCTFSGNTVSDNYGSQGGGVKCYYYSSPTVTDCLFSGNSADYGGGIYCHDNSSPTFSYCTFVSNSADYGGAMCCYYTDPAFSNCTFFGDSADQGSAIFSTGSPTVENTVIAFGTGGEAVHCEYGGSATLICCDVYANAGGDWVDCIAGQAGTNGNISEDPLFCSPNKGDFRIHDSSPCAPFTTPNPECDLIGAWPAGCPAPYILAVSPEPNELNVPASTNISVTFSISMDESTINNSTFVVHARSTGLHQGTITYDSPTGTATLNPSVNFDEGEAVTVVLTTGIESSGGAPLESSYIWSFTVQTSDGSGIFHSASAYTVGDHPMCVCAADFDGDGDIDLATANFYSNDVSMLRNNGSGSFSAHVDYTTFYNPVAICASDLDGDGDVDIAAGGETGVGDSVSVLLNNGNATFGTHSCYAVTGHSLSICAADLNGDGDIDLATACMDSDTLSVLLNHGDGSFASHTPYAAGDRPHSVTAADLDGDGDLDLATANMYSDDASILLNNGDGTFAPQALYSVDPYPASVFAADLNGNGSVDLATATSEGVSVLMNDGDGTFSPHVDYAVGGDIPASISVADLDGDGDLDLSTVNWDSHNASVLLNNGDGTYGPYSVHPIVGYYPRSVSGADLDGDGDIDLAVATENSDSVTVLYNLNLICGDFTQEGIVDIGDQSDLVKYLWLDGSAPSNYEQVDMDDYKVVTWSDFLRLFDLLWGTHTPLDCDLAHEKLSGPVDSSNYVELIESSFPPNDTSMTLHFYLSTAVSLHMGNLPIRIRVDDQVPTVTDCQLTSLLDDFYPVNTCKVDEDSGKVLFSFGKPATSGGVGPLAGEMATVQIGMPASSAARPIAVAWDPFPPLHHDPPEYDNEYSHYPLLVEPDKTAWTPHLTVRSCCVGLTGNVDADPGEIIDIGDVTALLDYLYIRPGVEPPDCMPEANVDGDPGGIVDIGDVTALLDYLYIRPGVEPPAECP